MPDTVRENIFANLKTSLEAITTGNGFDNTIQEVRRYDINDETVGPFPMIVINPGREASVDNAYPLTSCRIEVELELWHRINPDETNPTDKILNSILGDIKKKLKQDVTRGGNAVDTHITGVEPFEDLRGQSEVGLFIDVVITYRHDQTDPKTVR